MASLFDKVVIGINKSVNSVSENSKTIIEKAKINNEIENYSNEKNKLFLQLGELIYNLHMAGEIDIPQTDGIVSAVSACNNYLKALESKLQEIEIERMRGLDNNMSVENGIKCDCGYINNVNAKFCAGCGREIIIKNNSAERVDVRVCECGYENKKSANFCMKCGRPLKK